MASLPCHRIVAFARERNLATPLLLAIAPSPSTSLVIVGEWWPCIHHKHRMVDSLTNCARERMERAKNRWRMRTLERMGTEVVRELNGDWTGMEQEWNGYSHSVARTECGNFLLTPTVLLSGSCGHYVWIFRADSGLMGVVGIDIIGSGIAYYILLTAWVKIMAIILYYRKHN